MQTLPEKLRDDHSKGLSIAQIAEKHGLSEARVRTLIKEQPRGSGKWTKDMAKSPIVQKTKSNLTESERRALSHLEDDFGRQWRNFWIRSAFEHGYSVTEIANEFEVSQATVYNILK